MDDDEVGDDLRLKMGPVHTLDDLFIFYFEIWDLYVCGFAGLRTILVFGILAATLLRSSCRSCPLFLFKRLAMHIIGDRLYLKKSMALTLGGDLILFGLRLPMLPYLE